MTVTLNKNLKFGTKTIFRETKGIVVGVSNSEAIKKEYLGEIAGDEFYYLVNFPELDEIVLVDKKYLEFR